MADRNLTDLVGPIARRQQDRSAPGIARPPVGRMAELADWLAAAQGLDRARPLTRVRVVVVADGAGHQRVHQLAEIVGATVREEPAPEGPALDLVRAGVAVAEAEADEGSDLLAVSVPYLAPGIDTGTLIGLLTSKDASLVTDSALDDPSWITVCAQVRDEMRRLRPTLADHPALLDGLGARPTALVAGLLLGAAARRTPVLLDGPVTAAAALVAQRASFRAADWWLAGDQSAHPAHEIALTRLGLSPLLALGAPAEDVGTGLLAVPLLRAAAAA